MIGGPKNGKEAERIICGEMRKYTISSKQWQEILRNESYKLRWDNPRLYGQSSFGELKGRAIARVRDIIRDNLSIYLDKFRSSQMEKNPASPDNKFALNLLGGIREELEDVGVPLNDDKYDLRYYSTIDAIADHASGVDCWVELVEKQEDGSFKAINTFFIDVTARGAKARNNKEKLTNAVFYYDFEDVVGQRTGENNVSDRMIYSQRFDDLLIAIATKFKASIQPLVSRHRSNTDSNRTPSIVSIDSQYFN